MGSQRAGDVVKARLPECNIVEQSLDKNHLGQCRTFSHAYKPPLLPGRKRCAKTVPMLRRKVDDVSGLAQREDECADRSIGAVRVEQADLAQQIVGITQCRQMTAQTSAGRVNRSRVSDQVRIMQPGMPR